AGSDDAVAGVEDAFALEVRPDRADLAVGDRDVAGVPGRAAAVDHRAAADHEVSRHQSPSFLSRTILPITPAGGPATVPPSTGIVTPVTCADRSLAKYIAVCATSSGDPCRCNGCVNSITGPMS